VTWVKLDDGFDEHRKVMPLSANAFRLFVEALCFCNRNATDGELTKLELAKLWRRGKERDELVIAGLFEELDDGMVAIHDYLKYNPSRAQVEGRREAVSEKVRNHRQRKQCNPDVTGYTPEAVTQVGNHAPVPARPGPSPVSDANASSSGPAPPKPDNPQILRVFEVWQAEHGKPKAKLDGNRRGKIRARLREGFTPDRLCLAIRNAKNDAFLMGDNEHGKRYDDLKTLLRDAAQVERLEALTEPTKPRVNGYAKPPGAAEHEARQTPAHAPFRREASQPERIDPAASLAALRAVRGRP
jgi:hypothetical protein